MRGGGGPRPLVLGGGPGQAGPGARRESGPRWWWGHAFRRRLCTRRAHHGPGAPVGGTWGGEAAGGRREADGALMGARGRGGDGRGGRPAGRAAGGPRWPARLGRQHASRGGDLPGGGGGRRGGSVPRLPALPWVPQRTVHRTPTSGGADRVAALRPHGWQPSAATVQGRPRHGLPTVRAGVLVAAPRPVRVHGRLTGAPHAVGQSDAGRARTPRADQRRPRRPGPGQGRGGVDERPGPRVEDTEAPRSRRPPPVGSAARGLSVWAAARAPIVPVWVGTAAERPQLVRPGPDARTGGDGSACLPPCFPPGLGVLGVAVRAAAVGDRRGRRGLRPAVVARYQMPPEGLASAVHTRVQRAPRAGPEVWPTPLPGRPPPRAGRRRPPRAWARSRAFPTAAMSAWLGAWTTSRSVASAGWRGRWASGASGPSRAGMPRRAPPGSTRGVASEGRRIWRAAAWGRPRGRPPRCTSGAGRGRTPASAGGSGRGPTRGAPARAARTRVTAAGPFGRGPARSLPPGP